MPIFRPMFAFGLSLAIAGCAPTVASSGPQFLPEPLQFSQKADITFAYLSLEEAMRGDDGKKVLDAAQKLLETAPTSHPLADAAGWLMANRYSEEAGALLAASVKALPNDLPLHIMLSETLLEEGDLDGAITVLHQFTSTHPKDAAAKVEMALLYMKAEKFKEALAYFNKLPLSELNPSVRYYHAQALRASGQLAAAASTLRTTLAEAPDFLEAILELALVEEQRTNYGEARKLYEKLLTYDEGNQDILLRLVMVCLKAGNPQRAYAIASSMPDSLAFALTASSLFMEEGRFDLAGTLLDMMAKQPDAPEDLAFYRAAVAYEGEKNNDKALSLLSTINSSSRYYDKALRLRMQIYYGMKNLEKALQVAAEAIQAYPADLELRYAHMELLVAMKRLPEALASAKEAIQKWPEESDLAFQYAWLYALNGDPDEAMRLMEAIIERDPEHAASLNYVGYTLADEKRDLDRALALLLKAVELSPDTDYMLDSLAWAQFRLALYKDAWETIQHAIALASKNTPDPAMWEHYGDIAHALGLHNEARQGWTKALEISSPKADSIRVKLENLP